MKSSEIFTCETKPISAKETLFAMSECIKESILNDYTNVEKIIDIPRDLSASNGRSQYQIESMKYFPIEVGYFVYLSFQCNNINCDEMQATSNFRYQCSPNKKPKEKKIKIEKKKIKKM